MKPLSLIAVLTVLACAAGVQDALAADPNKNDVTLHIKGKPPN